MCAGCGLCDGVAAAGDAPISLCATEPAGPACGATCGDVACGARLGDGCGGVSYTPEGRMWSACGDCGGGTCDSTPVHVCVTTLLLLLCGAAATPGCCRCIPLPIGITFPGPSVSPSNPTPAPASISHLAAGAAPPAMRVRGRLPPCCDSAAADGANMSCGCGCDCGWKCGCSCGTGCGSGVVVTPDCGCCEPTLLDTNWSGWLRGSGPSSISCGCDSNTEAAIPAAVASVRRSTIWCMKSFSKSSSDGPLALASPTKWPAAAPCVEPCSPIAPRAQAWSPLGLLKPAEEAVSCLSRHLHTHTHTHTHQTR